MSELRECPFCGGEAAVETWEPCNDYSGNGYLKWAASIGCCVTFRSNYQYATPDEAIYEVSPKWNTRATPKVKPLEWHKSNITPWDDDYHTIGSGYSIRCAYENGWKWSNAIGGVGYAGTPSCAKEQAQSDYERRILEALA